LKSDDGHYLAVSANFPFRSKPQLSKRCAALYLKHQNAFEMSSDRYSNFTPRNQRPSIRAVK